MIGFQRMSVFVFVGALLALVMAACGGQTPAPPASAPAVSAPVAEALTPGDAYVCPMHPEVTSGSPGRCTKCGMDLVPREEAAAMAPAGGDTASDPHAGHDH